MRRYIPTVLLVLGTSALLSLTGCADLIAKLKNRDADAGEDATAIAVAEDEGNAVDPGAAPSEPPSEVAPDAEVPAAQAAPATAATAAVAKTDTGAADAGAKKADTSVADAGHAVAEAVDAVVDAGTRSDAGVLRTPLRMPRQVINEQIRKFRLVDAGK